MFEFFNNLCNNTTDNNISWKYFLLKTELLPTRQVRAILNVENWSRFTLLDSQTDIHCGAVLPRYQATNVYPGYREVMLGVGTEIFGGTCGTVSWQVRYLPPLLVFDLQYKLVNMSPHVGVGTMTGAQ